jgi:DNA (cytosine-5)-methyltransferase 1
MGDSKRWPTAAWNVGEGRMIVSASEWPVKKRYISLDTFLKYALTPLSVRATSGFLRRTGVAKLRFPPGFIEAVQAHLESVSPERLISRQPDISFAA